MNDDELRELSDAELAAAHNEAKLAFYASAGLPKKEIRLRFDRCVAITQERQRRSAGRVRA